MSEKSKGLYLIHIEGAKKPQNKYQAAIIEMVNKYNRTMVDDPIPVLALMEARIIAMHQKFSSCKVVGTTLKLPPKGNINQDLYFSIGDFMSFRLLEIKGRIQDKNIQPFIEFGGQLTTVKQETIL